MPFKNVTPDDLFKCHKCGDCCKGYGGTFVSPADIEKIASYIDAPESSFVETYCKFSGGKPVLAQKKDGFCVFWDELCTIHPVKPKMCREWPYIESVIHEPKNWEIMSGACPGIRASFPLDIVVKCIKQKRNEQR